MLSHSVVRRAGPVASENRASVTGYVGHPIHRLTLDVHNWREYKTVEQRWDIKNGLFAFVNHVFTFNQIIYI